jgi:hypothetical protein
MFNGRESGAIDRAERRVGSASEVNRSTYLKFGSMDPINVE